MFLFLNNCKNVTWLYCFQHIFTMGITFIYLFHCRMIFHFIQRAMPFQIPTDSMNPCAHYVSQPHFSHAFQAACIRIRHQQNKGDSASFGKIDSIVHRLFRYSRLIRRICPRNTPNTKQEKQTFINCCDGQSKVSCSKLIYLCFSYPRIGDSQFPKGGSIVYLRNFYARFQLWYNFPNLIVAHIFSPQSSIYCRIFLSLLYLSLLIIILTAIPYNLNKSTHWRYKLNGRNDGAA